MRRISLFVEDRGHELFLSALVERFAEQYGIAIQMTFGSARGGHGKMVSRLKSYINDLQKEQGDLSDLLIIATDGNCKGYLGRKQEIDNAIKGYSGYIIYAIPDPHIERWLLLDSRAFKAVLGKGCSAPTQKCERDLYKRLLGDAVKETGKNLPFGGIEYAAELAHAMDLDYLERTEDSLGRLLKELRQKFQEWAQPDQKGPQKLRESEVIYILQANSPQI